jgi:hypothetical protein
MFTENLPFSEAVRNFGCGFAPFITDCLFTENLPKTYRFLTVSILGCGFAPLITDLLFTVCLPKIYRFLKQSVILGVVLHPLFPTVCLPKTYRKLTVFLLFVGNFAKGELEAKLN